MTSRIAPGSADGATPRSSPPVPLGPRDLAVERLSWRPHGRRQATLTGLELDLRAGERVLLVGASGSGKSTLLRAMAGLLDESLGELTGQVRLGDGPPGRRPGQVGLMLQDPVQTLVAEHAGRDAAFGPENTQQPPPDVRARAAAALAAVRFPYGADRRSTELSGGQTQRLSLAGTLALDPELLLLDEPTAMLDDRAAGAVREAVRSAADQRGFSLVVVEHRLGGWLEICDRLVVLGPGGTIAADGPAAEVLRDHRAALDAAGVWLPDSPPPQPVPLDWDDPDGPPDASSPGPVPSEPTLDGHPGSRAEALRCAGLTVAAPGKEPRDLVQHLDLSLSGGRAMALLGSSGSGKSTLLRTLAGFHRPVAGEVLLSGQPVERLVRDPVALAGAVAWLPQQLDQLITARTVLAEVLATSEQLYARQPARLAAARSRAQRILRALGLWQLRGADPYQLSVGEQRRMGLAAVVVHGPRLLLLDEPTVGQDRQTWAAVLGVVRALQHEGVAVLASTHDVRLAEALGETIWLTDEQGPLTLPEPADYEVSEVAESGAAPAASCNPLALLTIALGAAVGSFFVADWRVGALALALVVVLAPLAVRDPRAVGVRRVPRGRAALTVGWSTLVFSSRGAFAATAWPVAAREVLRICYLVVPGVLIVPSLPPSRLGDALAQRARLPHHLVVVAAAALLRVQQLLDTWRQMVETRTIRALHPGRSFPRRVRYVASLTFALLVWTLRSAQQMAVSMDARGFATARRRTFALPSRWRRRDWLCIAVAALLLTAPAVLTALA